MVTQFPSWLVTQLTAAAKLLSGDNGEFRGLDECGNGLQGVLPRSWWGWPVPRAEPMWHWPAASASYSANRRSGPLVNTAATSAVGTIGRAR